MSKSIYFYNNFMPKYLVQAVYGSNWRVVLFGEKEDLSLERIESLVPSRRISVYNSANVLIFRGAAKNLTFAYDDKNLNDSFNALREMPKFTPNARSDYLRIYKESVCFPNSISKENFDKIAPYYSSSLAKLVCNCIQANFPLEEAIRGKTIEFECDGNKLLYFATDNCLDIINLDTKEPVGINDELFIKALDVLHFISVL